MKCTAKVFFVNLKDGVFKKRKTNRLPSHNKEMYEALLLVVAAVRQSGGARFISTVVAEMCV